MTRRLVAAVLTPPVWTPPGVDPHDWRVALAEDLFDVLALMVEVEPAAITVGTDAAMLRSVLGWPGLRWYDAPAPEVTEVLAALTPTGADAEFDQVALVAADAPDLPGLHIAKLLRPLTTRPVAIAPATDGPGLLGLACRLPAPAWLPALPLDRLTAAEVRAAAPRAADVAVTAGWHRLRSAATLDGLDPRREGWDATRLALGV
jgi:glycosyltransferase A (GT-A) superfamily protein (DUF2064 family)